MRAVVTGMIGTYPVGGVAWDYGQYALGLQQLGFEVYYLEDTGCQTYDPEAGTYGDDCSYGASFLESSLCWLSPGLEKRWHFRDVHGQALGLGLDEVADLVAEADLLLNVSGGCLLREEYMACRRKVLIDTDPGWNHFVNYPRWDRSPGWLSTHGYRGHDFFFTYAERIGRPDCPLSTLGLGWRPTRPPVILDAWQPRPPGAAWTTVMTWDNFRRPIEHEGVVYGSKELEFGRVEELPQHVPAELELAVGGTDAPRERWRSRGWRVVDSHSISRTPDEYRSYLQQSRGEFSVAKNVYVATHCGWFSCRTVCYLAAQRPAVVQDTGFSELLPTGEGLVVFSTLEEAAAGIARIEADYEHHQREARAVAETYFDARIVLTDMLGQIGL
ncbi:MAG: glycosyltransferase family 1 protein [Armatimonadetes bacterium]|nr:glycosyltransferase family 1 protein [Armatimonadota bacterium]